MPQTPVQLMDADDAFKQFDTPAQKQTQQINAPTPPPTGLTPQILSDLTGGVSPSVLAQRVAGAIGGLFNALPGGSTRDTSRTLPALTPEQQQGQRIMAVGSMAPSAAGAIDAVTGGLTSTVINRTLSAIGQPNLLQKGATAAGVPQFLGELGSLPMTQWPQAAMRAGARALYHVPEGIPEPTPPSYSFDRPGPVNAEFVEPPEQPIDVESKPVPPPGAKQVTNTPAPKELAPVPPGTKLSTGEEGGIGPQPHADVVGQQRMIVRAYKGDGSGYTPGQMRPETVNEMKGRLTNFGRGLTSQPHADAEPYVPPKPPKPTPPKTKAQTP